MRKLKVLLSHNVNPYSELLASLATEGITTDVALLKVTDLKSLSVRTGIPSQVLRGLQQQVIDLTTAAEEKELLHLPITKFSTGYSILDDALYGGYEFGRIIEIYGCTEKAKTFLNDYPEAIVHHIDTSGTFEPRLIGDQNQQMMTRIYCYEAFTASELHQLLEQISALHITTTLTTVNNNNNNNKPSTCSLIIINGIVNLMTTEWDQVTTTKVSDMLCTMASVRKLSLSILMLRTAQVVSDEFSSHQNNKILPLWDHCIDLRIHLQQTPQQPSSQLPPPPSFITSPSTYQCDIEKARIPVADTRVVLTEI
ncbi:hypothetical protein BDA99DRAFT_562414 [Phascolomyces articulosus]|uniref:Uncharacterized protein n=1 Tax=Phascolomyces articulosus TaxID=60185 RepID=A0AAD5PB74_9FUNG|nr:hypothetical protein BDA99DRAFT_562414 [Phascolomyces articulosus]